MKITHRKTPYYMAIHFNAVGLEYYLKNSAEFMFLVGCMVSIGMEITEDFSMPSLYALDGMLDKLTPIDDIDDTLYNFFETGINSGQWFHDFRYSEHQRWYGHLEKSEDIYSRVEYQRNHPDGRVDIIDFNDDVLAIQQWFNILIKQEPSRIYRYLTFFNTLTLEEWVAHIHMAVNNTWFPHYFDQPDMYVSQPSTLTEMTLF